MQYDTILWHYSYLFILFLVWNLPSGNKFKKRLPRRWWTKRLTKCVRSFWRKVSKSVVPERWKITWWNRWGGQLSKWGWIGTQKRAMEKFLFCLLVCILFARDKRIQYVSIHFKVPWFWSVVSTADWICRQNHAIRTMLIIVIIVIVAIVIIVIRVLAYCRSSCSVIMSVMFDHLLSFCFDTAQTRWFIAGMKSQKLEIPSRSIFGPCWTYPSPGDCRSASGNSRNCRRRSKETPRGIFPLHEGGGRKTCFDFFAMGFSWTWDMVKQCEMVKSAKQRHGPPTIYIYIYICQA